MNDPRAPNWPVPVDPNAPIPTNGYPGPAHKDRTAMITPEEAKMIGALLRQKAAQAGGEAFPADPNMPQPGQPFPPMKSPFPPPPYQPGQPFPADPNAPRM